MLGHERQLLQETPLSYLGSQIIAFKTYQRVHELPINKARFYDPHSLAGNAQ